MSNTSLKKIQIPALNHANFGKAIMEQFANIDANFQKLSNFELNAGVPGKSCLYATINLAAPFVYPTSDINNPQKNTTDWNAWVMWSEYDRVFTAELQDTWTQLKESVAADYEQFRRLTGLREYEYAAIAAKMLWGYSISFTGSDSAEPTPESLTGALRAKYGSVEGPVECEDINGNKTTYYGNWLAEIFMMNKPDDSVIAARAEFFKKHLRITVPGRIIVALSPSDKEIAYYPVGSLEYWYIDPRFRNAAVDRADTMVQDMSCVMHWTPEGTTDDISWPGHFEILEIFPTIRRGADGKYYWFINGMNTGVPVQGPAGRDGASAKLVIVQRVENVLGYHPENYPNGKLAVGPRIGDWRVPMSAFAGDSPRNLPSRTQMVNDMPTIVPQWVKGGNWPGWPENLIPIEQNEYGRTTSFQLKVDKGTAWLGNYEDGYVLNEPENLFRIYRIVGREIFWMGPDKSDIPDEKDPVNHRYDPSCDEYYFKRNHASEPSDSTTIQQLIEQLDGATAIVLPGPAYQYDRTDSTYWITTLRKVEWHKSDTDENARSGRYMLMAYCSDEERIHNSLDEHTQAGMMQRLDAYAYKSNGDNRNKPRGLMLPIGSAYAAYTDGNFEWAWASHIMHSDCGGFAGFEDGRGIQHVNTINKKQTVASDTMHDVTGQAMSAAEAQYTEIIGKRVLHIGSVNDYRALNYVENHTDKGWNGGVPGRIEPSQNLPGKIGNADFYGRMVYGKWINGRRTQWFEGSELHVDEPLTITRYRDLHKRQRLLNVEGDVVIGPRTHKNGPGLTYRNRDGGLVVHSTISPDTGEDLDIFPASYTPSNTIFSREWYGGLALNHRAFYNTLADAGEQSWKTQFGRWKYGEGNYRAFYETDDKTISTTGPIARENYRHMFSILGDDGIGARVMVAQDGFAVYNPNWAKENGKKLTSFSVDAMGNIQTMGKEVRSNADETLWIFHSRWTGEPHSYADMQYRDKYGVADIEVDWSWLNTSKGDLKNMIFTFPGHNQLMYGTDHEAQFIYEENRSIKRLERSWRATNFYPWKDTENTTLCRVPMGWIINFGPIDDTGYHMRTFMEKRNGSFGQSWGSNELMPVTTVWSSDINHFHGVLHVNGADCMAIRSKAKEYEHLQTQYLSGRYGSQVAHGLIVGPALRTINNDNGTPRVLDAQDFLNESLHMQYRSISWWENGTANSAEWGQGAEASPMFAGITRTPIAIWGRGSIFAQNSLIADEDLVVNRAATIRAQARAKSFRRHYSSLNTRPFDNGYCGWSLLLDNGLSSHNAPRHTIKDGGNDFNNSTNTPIILDLGENLGKKRLVRFGYAKNATLNNSNDVVVDIVSKDEVPDRKLCLFGKFPDDVAGVKYFAFGNVIRAGYHQTHKSKEVKTYSGTAPQWMRDILAKNNVVAGGYETSVVEVITTPYLVIVNLYICLRAKWEQKGGNRCMRGIYGAGLGSNDHEMRMWRNLATNLKIENVPLPEHPVYANMHSCLPASNKNKDGDWKVKGLNGDKPQSPGIVWRLDPDGSIWLDSSAEGMALMGNDDSAPVVTASFMYSTALSDIESGSGGSDGKPDIGGDIPPADDDDDDTGVIIMNRWTANQVTTTTISTWLSSDTELYKSLTTIEHGDLEKLDDDFGAAIIDYTGSQKRVYVDIWTDKIAVKKLTIANDVINSTKKITNVASTNTTGKFQFSFDWNGTASNIQVNGFDTVQVASY